MKRAGKVEGEGEGEGVFSVWDRSKEKEPAPPPESRRSMDRYLDYYGGPWIEVAG